MLKHSAFSHMRSVCNLQHSMYTDCKKRVIDEKTCNTQGDQKFPMIFRKKIKQMNTTSVPLRAGMKSFNLFFPPFL